MMRFYRLLLRLYPLSFRTDYEEELEDVFAERTSEWSGPLAGLWIALAGVADVVPNAIAAHWDLLVHDVRFAVRSLSRAPGFAVTAILVSALGVGANTLAFSLGDFVLVRPLPFEQPHRLIKFWQSNPTGYSELSPPNFRDYQEQARSFEAMGAYTTRAANLVGTGSPRRLETIHATAEVLPLLGVPPLIGRHFDESDAATGHSVVLAYALWQSQFGSDPAIVGRVVRLDGVPHTIVGVMPASFHFPHRGVEAWTPLVLRDEDMEDRTNTYLEAVARVRDGVTLERASRELAVVASRLEMQHPDNRDIGVRVLPLRDDVSSRARMLVIALCGAAICILLLSCANLASLFLARGTHRARELAVRSALGAGRERLVRQLVTESAAIAVAGGLVGVVLAAISVPLLTRLVPSTLPIAEYPSVDLRVLVLAAGFVILTGLTFGVLPAVRAGRSKAIDALRLGSRGGGGSTQRLRAGRVIIEIVASVVLLIMSGLLIRSVWNIQSTAPGFQADDVLRIRTALPLPKYETVARRSAFYTAVLDQVRALPGVKSAAYITGLPMEMRGGIWPVSFDGAEAPRDGSHDVSLRFVTPELFSTLQIPLRRGRDVSDRDTAGQPFVAVVSESFAKRHWPSEDPIGRTFEVAFSERTVVGVVGDVRVRGLERPSEPQVYLPYQQVEDGGLIGYVPKELLVRTESPPESLIAPIQRLIRNADPEQPISNVRTMAAIVVDDTAPRVTQLRLLGALAGIALLIAGIGIHGLLSYTVSRRTQELGVRRVLGAQGSEIVGSVMREGVALAATGIAIGMVVAYLAARGMSALLVGVDAGDPLTFAVASALCLTMGLAGCLAPALRAARVDPLTALRAE